PIRPMLAPLSIRVYGMPIAALGCAALFGWHFDPSRTQWAVDGAWALALVLWTVGTAHGSAGWRWPSAGALWPLGALLVLFAAAWLPFYDNWRWAFTGDSVTWFSVAAEAAERQHLARN